MGRIFDDFFAGFQNLTVIQKDDLIARLLREVDEMGNNEHAHTGVSDDIQVREDDAHLLHIKR